MTCTSGEWGTNKASQCLPNGCNYDELELSGISSTGATVSGDKCSAGQVVEHGSSCVFSKEGYHCVQPVCNLGIWSDLNPTLPLPLPLILTLTLGVWIELNPTLTLTLTALSLFSLLLSNTKTSSNPNPIPNPNPDPNPDPNPRRLERAKPNLYWTPLQVQRPSAAFCADRIGSGKLPQ